MEIDKINFKKMDPEGMIDKMESFPELCQTAYDQFDRISLPAYYIKPQKYVILGMGGSGIAGGMIKDLLFDKNVVVEVVKKYDLPGWVDKDTLVIANSYSGNTEETINAFIQAKEKGAKLFAITTGGRLKTFVDKFSIPSFEFTFEAQPRAAFPFLFIALVVLFEKLGRISITQDEMSENVDQLKNYLLKYKSSTNSRVNPAKILAQKIQGKVPVIYSAGTLESVGHRFKSQINENSKNWAFSEVFPELDHNSIMGLSHPQNNHLIIFLESNFDHARVILRQNITAEILKKNKIVLERVKIVPCNSKLLEILHFVMLTDFVSYYLALLNNENPTAINNIVYLKEELSK